MSALKIIGISGSLRKASVNTGLLRAISKHFQAPVSFEIVNIGDLPLFNADLEKPDFPESVLRFRKQIKECDGVVFAAPENNYSISAPLKNALDWGSRGDNPWNDKPAAVFGAGGGAGAIRAHHSLRQSAVYVNIHFMNKPEVGIKAFEAPPKFDWTTGDLIDEETDKRLKEFGDAFIVWVRRFK